MTEEKPAVPDKTPAPSTSAPAAAPQDAGAAAFKPEGSAAAGPAIPEAAAAGGQASSPASKSAAAPQAGEMNREERIAAAKARAEALKAQRAAGGAGTAAPAGAAPAKPAAPARPTAASGFKPLVAAKNPGGAPAVAPQNPKVRAFGTLTQAVEIACDATEEANLQKILGGLGLYKNPLRGIWQLDYRYYAEAVRRLRAAGYEIDGKDYLGRPLEQWVAEARGWTRLE